MIEDLLHRPAVVAGAAVVAVLGIGGALTRIGPWYEKLRKPSWQPPGWLFGPVWTTIAGLTVWSVSMGWPAVVRDGGAGTMIGLFAINAAFNVGWSALFFTLHRPDWAMIEVAGLWLSVAALMIGMAQHSVPAALLLLPYLVWVAIAAFLNLAVVRLNRPFGAAAAQVA